MTEITDELLKNDPDEVIARIDADPDMPDSRKQLLTSLAWLNKLKTDQRYTDAVETLICVKRVSVVAAAELRRRIEEDAIPPYVLQHWFGYANHAALSRPWSWDDLFEVWTKTAPVWLADIADADNKRRAAIAAHEMTAWLQARAATPVKFPFPLLAANEIDISRGTTVALVGAADVLRDVGDFLRSQFHPGYMVVEFDRESAPPTDRRYILGEPCWQGIATSRKSLARRLPLEMPDLQQPVDILFARDLAACFDTNFTFWGPPQRAAKALRTLKEWAEETKTLVVGCVECDDLSEPYDPANPAWEELRTFHRVVKVERDGARIIIGNGTHVLGKAQVS